MHCAWSKFEFSKQKYELMPLPTKIDSNLNSTKWYLKNPEKWKSCACSHIMSPTYHVKYKSCNMDAFSKNVFTNKTIRHGLTRLFHPSDRVDCKTRAFKVVKRPNLASVRNISLQTTLLNRVLGFASKLSFHFLSAKSECFCEAATRHEGQHDTTAIF
jgi:hypothetical protein